MAFNLVWSDACAPQLTLGLYSALRACRAILFKSSFESKFTVDTMFLQNKHGSKNMEEVNGHANDFALLK